MKKVGIYSGVFDPVHHGHISFARRAARELGLDIVYFTPEPRPRRKQNPSDIRHRLNMLWLALQDIPELELLPLDHHQFTVRETLPLLQEKFPGTKLHLLLGTDLFKYIHTWPDFETLQRQVRFVVGQRDGNSSADSPIAHHAIGTQLSDLTSTSARQRQASQLAGLVPDPVAQYISAQQLYR